MSDDALAPLIAAARAARANAHAPYSGFPVGAALRTDSGAVFAGANVENAAYPQGQCAEASAIGAMVAAGERRIAAVVVMGGEAADGLLCTPCGGCRQRLREFAADDAPVHVCGPEGLRRTFTLGELLPHSFGPDILGPRGEGEGRR
ncbi:cytidine deaminase [Azospirillum sp. ST 5-10]|uniref:cytidine deaminase n=1 Tax=unclassified Azospirillum TaxID=2630922 RepID=UPI003F4A687D